MTRPTRLHFMLRCKSAGNALNGGARVGEKKPYRDDLAGSAPKSEIAIVWLASVG